MTTRKLTPAQAEALRVVAEGGIPKSTPLRVLVWHGLVVARTRRLSVVGWRLTKTGRLALVTARYERRVG